MTTFFTRFVTSFLFGVLLLFNAFGQKQYHAPALSASDSWSMILLPDPQTYNKFERNQPIFELMTAWISENIDKLNIKLVMCTGDLVEQNEIINPNGVSVNQPSKKQWEAVARGFSRMDGKVPYMLRSEEHTSAL